MIEELKKLIQETETKPKEPTKVKVPNMTKEPERKTVELPK